MAVVAPIVSSWNDKGIRDAEKDFDTFGSKAGNVLGGIGEIAKKTAKLVAGIGVAGVAGAGVAINAASDLGEAQSKVGVIFGDSSKDIEAFAATAAKKFGQSKQDVLDAAGTFGTFGKAAGLGGKDLANFSNDFTGLASDLASFSNTTPQEAIDAIGSALRGESEPLRKYGVLLDDASLRAKAFELGISDGKGPLTAQQKILAAQKLIFEQTGDAQGDFARTSDGLANQSRILKASLSNVVTEIGVKLLPIALKLASFFTDKLLPIIESVSKTFSEEGFGGVLRKLGDYIRTALPPALEALVDILKKIGAWIIDTGLPWLGEKLSEAASALWEWIKEAAPPALKKLGELIGDLASWLLDKGLPMLVEKLIKLGDALVEWIKPQIVPMLKQLGDLLLKILDWIVTEAIPKLGAQAVKLGGALLGWIAELLPEALYGLGRFVLDLVGKLPGLFLSLVNTAAGLGLDIGGALVDGLIKLVSGLGSKIKDASVGMWDGIKEAFKAAVNFIIKGWNKIEFKIPGFKIGPIGYDGFTLGLPDIPLLASGGIVNSPTLAMIGEAGPEAVVPLRGSNMPNGLGGGITINVSGALDPVGVARQIREILNQDQSRFGALSVI